MFSGFKIRVFILRIRHEMFHFRGCGETNTRTPLERGFSLFEFRGRRLVSLGLGQKLELAQAHAFGNCQLYSCTQAEPLLGFLFSAGFSDYFC